MGMLCLVMMNVNEVGNNINKIIYKLYILFM